jgi:hypothetical protein
MRISLSVWYSGGFVVSIAPRTPIKDTKVRRGDNLGDHRFWARSVGQPHADTAVQLGLLARASVLEQPEQRFPVPADLGVSVGDRLAQLVDLAGRVMRREGRAVLSLGHASKVSDVPPVSSPRRKRSIGVVIWSSRRWSAGGWLIIWVVAASWQVMISGAG